MNFEIEKAELLFDEFKAKSDKALEFVKSEYSVLRAGRANAKLLDKITADYYGTQTPLTQMANISSPEPRVLVINLWDKSALKNAEKAILAANIGVTPNNDGNVIRLIFPELNEERRRELVKTVKKLAEDCKVVVRNARRDVIEACKKLEKDKDISEDDLKLFEKEADDRTAKLIETADKLAKEKEADIMAV